jgi:hypothetical protein
MKKEFCPPYCLFGDLDESLGCDQCHHSKDKTYDKPIDIDLLWYADIWIKAQILGESGSDYIIKSPKAEGVITTKKNSPHIRK